MNTLYLDLTRNCLVVSPVNPTRVLPPALTIGDTVPITLAFLLRNPQPLNTGTPVYLYQDYSAKGVVLSLAPDPAPPTAGNFVLTWGGDSTGALAFNISSYALSVALNALASITAAGGVTVAGNVGGPYQITFLTPAAQPVFTVPANGLFPASTISCVIDQAGSVALSAVMVLSLTQNAVVQVSSWTPQAAAAVTITALEADVIQRVSIPAGTYGGSFTLSYNGNVSVAIPFDAQIDLVASALNALTGITGATVIAGQNYWDITIPGGTFALVGNPAGLIIPLTLTGSLVLTSQGLLDLLAGQPCAPVPFSIAATASGNQTLFAGQALVNEGPAGGAAAPALGVAQVLPRPDINGITATSDSLDKVATASSAVAVGTIFVLTLPVGGFQAGGGWQLIVSPPASNGVTSQRPIDYNASTNNVGWIKIF